VTPSERRLHPVSVFFALGKSLKAFAIPLVFLLVGTQSTGRTGPFRGVPDSDNWDLWALWLLVPIAATAVARYLTFRMRYDGTELVIRSGLFFRNERHIPYARIQNLNAIRNVFHRMLGMTDVQIETASGQKAEATISVVPLSVLEEMRARVFEAKTQDSPITSDGTAEAAAAAPALSGTTILRLPFRELALLSVIQNRGFLPIAAAMGLLWEFGLLDRAAAAIDTGNYFGRDVVQGATRALLNGEVDLWQMGGALATIVGALVLVQTLSLLWVVTRLHGFALARSGEDLRTDYGLFTRVASTIPLRRVQTLAVQQGPLQRLAGRAAVRLQTAGGGAVPSGGMSAEFGGGGNARAGSRQWLAPIIRLADVPALVQAVLPDLDVSMLTWSPPHPRAFRRAVKRGLLGWLLLSLIPLSIAVSVFGAWSLAVLPIILGWSVVVTRQQVHRMAWSVTDDVIAYRSGWLWQHVTVARTAKIQVVTRLESPFDRRTAMGRVRVDTAGGGDRSDLVDIPYLPRDVASSLYARLSLQAASTDFRW
jgi:putative membrane protein